MRKTGIFLGFLVLFLLNVPRAEAIPAWAKRYSMECSVCHAGPLYKLTPVGVEFMRLGHRMPGDTEMAANWNELFSINTKLRARDGNAPGYNSTFEVHAFSIYTGGPLSKHFSYFTEMYLYENTGKTSGPADSAYHTKLADAYLMYTSNDEKDIYTTVKFGQISPSQLLAYWNVGPRYSETRPYVVNNAAVSPNAYKPFMRNFGVEVAQSVKNFQAAFGVLNGTGASFTNSTDNNGAKDFYATLDYKIGSGGSAIGVYGYKGKGLITPAAGETPWENRFWRLGWFGQYTRGPFNFTAVATKGREQLNAQNLRANNLGLLLETDYEISPKLALFARYDYFDPNTDKTRDDLKGPVFGASYRLFYSCRATFEFHKQGKNVINKPKPWEYRTEVAFTF